MSPKECVGKGNFSILASPVASLVEDLHPWPEM